MALVLIRKPGYACDGLCLNDENNNGVCDELEVLGCAYVEACNFNPFATGDDGSCEFPDAGYDCDGACLYDVDSDGVCDQDEVTGCQDPAACNYNAVRRMPGTVIMRRRITIAMVLA